MSPINSTQVERMAKHFLSHFWRTVFVSDILSQSLVHPSILVHPSVAFPSQRCPFPAHLAPDVLSATTVCPGSSEWQNAKSQATFTWKRLALNSCSPLITLPASATPGRHVSIACQFSLAMTLTDWDEGSGSGV